MDEEYENTQTKKRSCYERLKNEINALHQNQSTHFGYDASLEIFEFDVWLFALLVATGSKYDL